MVMPGWIDYLKERNFKNPTDKNDSAWFDQTGKHYFDWLLHSGVQPRADAFHNHMKFKTMTTKWYEAMPLDKILGNVDPSEVLLVDVGGSIGHDLQGFHKAQSDRAGRLILQDLPAVVKSADVTQLGPVEIMAHDFFTPQPVRGAKAYYLKMVLHDWPDSEARSILENLKPALKAGYSKILINELVIPNTGADWFETSIDMIMMTVVSSHERRETEWKQLIESVGLELQEVWHYDGAPERLLEVALPGGSI